MTSNNIPQTPEAVALTLMEKIFAVQGKTVNSKGNQEVRAATPQEILSTYANCLNTVRYATEPAHTKPQHELA